ncbi:MAG TPA: DUF2252 family protein [Patescibacteria group bacterium]|nr:DUF2252 family protein [Patescibacteria group bacterium]
MSQDIVAATQSYEEWLATQVEIVAKDIATKHANMANSPFLFLRATYYRWAQTFPEVCPKISVAPKVLAVGDLHCENFGTWRDAEGRLAWGVNDFDEAWDLPYTHDLVRLATSLRLATAEDGFGLAAEDACADLLDGYTKAVRSKRAAFVLEERHAHLRALAEMNRGNSAAFWKKMTAQPATDDIPEDVRFLLLDALPKKAGEVRLSTRVAGQGSLGRQRFVAVAELDGGLVAREAKAAAPSACSWATSVTGVPPLYERILGEAVRCPDPFYALEQGRWVVRRLAPACSRIELDTARRGPDRRKLVVSMGAEIANVHFGKGPLDAVAADLAERSSSWLVKASGKMEDQVRADWKDWRRAFKGK